MSTVLVMSSTRRCHTTQYSFTVNGTGYISHNVILTIWPSTFTTFACRFQQRLLRSTYSFRWPYCTAMDACTILSYVGLIHEPVINLIIKMLYPLKHYLRYAIYAKYIKDKTTEWVPILETNIQFVNRS